MQGYRKLNIDWPIVLQQEYIIKHHGADYIGKKYDCCQKTVLKHLRIFGFEVRTLSESQKGKHRPQVIKDKMSKSHKGRKLTLEHRNNISKARKGLKLSKITREKMSISMKGKFAGEKHPNWQGGKTPEDKIIRNSVEYSDWRLAVFAKDGFACIGCGDKRGHNLQAHHILSFAKYPELRLDVSNGVTLCNDCHSKVHPDLGFIAKGA